MTAVEDDVICEYGTLEIRPFTERGVPEFNTTPKGGPFKGEAVIKHRFTELAAGADLCSGENGIFTELRPPKGYVTYKTCFPEICFWPECRFAELCSGPKPGARKVDTFAEGSAPEGNGISELPSLEAHAIAKNGVSEIDAVAKMGFKEARARAEFHACEIRVIGKFGVRKG